MVAGGGAPIYLYQVGGPQVTNNNIVATNTSGAIYAAYHAKGNNGFGDYGIMTANTAFSGGVGGTVVAPYTTGAYLVTTGNSTQ